MNFDQFLSIFYLLFLLYIGAIYPFDLLNFYVFGDPPENHFSVIGGLLVKDLLLLLFYLYYIISLVSQY